ncbi:MULTISPECIES: DUF1684 domain-containing protein [unclassified Frondihabitans]|uniref:DUF1684 domain-containing protein n=1 Tax=unclassified Frondihabitans TaxID=2626248 RepID=UPI000F4D8747|nr:MULTISPECIES: DUF1684 domain-containing protein [unclassified Frondihabitans]RPE74295.1 hypothetical protein EDF37_3036 [Frondihabitans sp. PhB153]RPF02724.1 hypothetical protein EDF39_3104 [Frondihabitans sp. PhB161]
MPDTLDTAAATAESGRDSWREGRLAGVTSPQGNLALIETRWLSEGTEITDAEALDGQPSTVTVTRLTRADLDTGRPEHGIRLWDSASPAIEHFDTISLFPFDPDWVIEAEFTPVSGDRVVPFEHIRDNGSSRDLVVPGDITFRRDGVDYRLSAFDDGGVLLLVFGDATNGSSDSSISTYGSGRFLFVQRPSGDAGFADAGPVVLDFNQAFVPPCGFSEQYNCPLPPKQNRFARPVLAGERDLVLRDGFDIHQH